MRVPDPTTFGDAGVREITVRLDKRFFSRATVECLERPGVRYLLKVRDHDWVRRELTSWRRSLKCQEITRDPAVWIWSSSGTLYRGRLLSLEWRRTETPEGALFSSERIVQRAHVLTKIPGLHALTAWRLYNDGAVVEQRIEELAQLGAGRTGVDDLWATPCSGRWRPWPTRSSTSFGRLHSREAGAGISRTGSGPGSSAFRPS